MQTKARIHVEPSPYNEFDRIPYSAVLIIFNKITDVQSLGRCAVESKHFNSLFPLAHDVFIKIDRVGSVKDDNDDNLDSAPQKPCSFFSHLLKLMLFTLKPFLQQRNSNNVNKPLLPQLLHHFAEHILKNFNHIHNLRIELPAGAVVAEDGVILKWKAEFGSTLQNCVILGGTQIDRKPLSDQEALKDNGSIPESFNTNGGLKLRVLWTISCLIAASLRHYLLQPIIRDHPTLQSLVLTDADGQGT